MRERASGVGLLRSSRWEAAGLFAGALLVSWLAACAWWVLLPASQQIELTVPRGTAELVRAGKLPPDLPSELMLRVGDTLSLRNLDSVAHRIGPVWVAAGAEERSVVGPGFFAGGALACSIHPAGALSVVPRARPGIETTVPVALFAGLPLGGAALVGLAIAARLDGQGGERPRRTRDD